MMGPLCGMSLAKILRLTWHFADNSSLTPWEVVAANPEVSTKLQVDSQAKAEDGTCV